MADVIVRQLDQEEWGKWDSWLVLQPWGSPFSSAWWLAANCRAFGGRPLILAAFDNDRMAGGVALRLTDIGPVHVVRPSMLYNPIVLGEGSTHSRQRALAALVDEMTRRRLVVRPLSCTTDTVDLREAVWRHWDLTVSWTTVSELKTWSADRSVSRAELKQGRKAERAGVVTRVEPLDADILYDLMQASMSRQHQDAYLTREQLRILAEAAGANGLLTVARDSGGAPLGAGFVMAIGPKVVYDVWAGTSTKGLEMGVAAARYLFLLRELQARGYACFDWCGASQPGYSSFKLEFGGTLTTRLAVTREPLWFRVAEPVYTRLHDIKRRIQR